jgi:protein-S-isoprenylcysteine O-methyltransferase Ste14
MKVLRPLLHVPVPWVFVLVYLIGVAIEQWGPSHEYPFAPIGVMGALAFALGAGFAGWTWVIFRRARTTTVPGQVSSKFVTWGPYSVSRNPMYVGLALAYLGEAGMLRQAWPAVLLPLILSYVNWVVIPVEEAKLQEAFGELFDGYRARVRRWL